MKKLHIRPTSGQRIRDPRSGEELPERGARVPDETYWQRLLRSGQVELVEEAPDPSKGGKPGKPGKNSDGGEEK